MGTTGLADDLIAGRITLGQVPASQHAELLVPLASAKNEANSRGDREMTKRIGIIIQNLQLGRTGINTAPRSRRSRSVASTSDSGLESLLAGIRTVESVALNDIEGFMTQAKQEQDTALENRDLDRAEACEQLLHKLAARMEALKRRDELAAPVEGARVRWMNAQAELEGLEEAMQREREDLVQARKEKVADLRAAHELALRAFDNGGPEELPSNYQKVSRAVLELRVQEKRLLQTHRFADAKPIRARADQLEAIEMEQAHARLDQSRRAERLALEKKQRLQADGLEREFERRLATHDRDAARAIFSRRIHVRQLQLEFERARAASAAAQAQIIARAATAQGTREV